MHRSDALNADVGATYFKALEGTGLLRVHHPGLHESFAMDHRVMKMLWEAGFHSLSYFIGFKSDKASYVGHFNACRARVQV